MCGKAILIPHMIRVTLVLQSVLWLHIRIRNADAVRTKQKQDIPDMHRKQVIHFQ